MTTGNMYYYYETDWSIRPLAFRAPSDEDAVRIAKRVCGEAVVIVYKETNDGSMTTVYKR